MTVVLTFLMMLLCCFYLLYWTVAIFADAMRVSSKNIHATHKLIIGS